jgi:hypothetical protein
VAAVKAALTPVAATTAYVTWSCGHREILERTLPAALAQPWHVILVDYSDPQDAGTWATRLRAPGLRVVRAAARFDAARHPVPSQARAWQAGLDALPEDGLSTVVLADPLCLVPPTMAAAIAVRPVDEAWWSESILVVSPAALRSHRLCPAYIGQGAEAADLRARLAADGVRLVATDLGVRLVARPPLPPLAAARLLGLRVGALALGEGPPLAALGRLAGGPVSMRNH